MVHLILSYGGAILETQIRFTQVESLIQVETLLDCVQNRPSYRLAFHLC